MRSTVVVLALGELGGLRCGQVAAHLAVGTGTERRQVGARRRGLGAGGEVPVNWKIVPVLASRPLFSVMVQMFFAASVWVAVKSPSFHVYSASRGPQDCM